MDVSKKLSQLSLIKLNKDYFFFASSPVVKTGGKRN